MLKIYLTNLGKYNEGELVGEWITLPISEKELSKVYKRIGISSEPNEEGICYEETFITDYETDIEGLKVEEYTNLDKLNDFAEILEDMDESEQEALQAFLLNSCDLEEAIENVQAENYIIYCDCNDMTDVAYRVVEEGCYLDNVPETVARYFDYEAFGRDLEIEGTFFQIDNDMVQIY